MKRPNTSKTLKRLYAEGKRTVSPKFYYAWLGKKRSPYVIQKLREAHLGKFDEKSTRWLGDKVGYDGLHDWVYKKLGAPMQCEKCKKVGKSNRQIHWANKSGKYKRNIKDWIRLCVKCHWWKDQSKRKRIGNKFV